MLGRVLLFPYSDYSLSLGLGTACARWGNSTPGVTRLYQTRYNVEHDDAEMSTDGEAEAAEQELLQNEQFVLS